MSLTIELREDVENALASQARAAKMPTERYVAHLVGQAVENGRVLAARDLERNLDSMASKIAPTTTTEQMEEALAEALSAIRPHRNW